VARDLGPVGRPIGAHVGLRSLELQQLWQTAQSLLIQRLHALDLLSNESELFVLSRNHLMKAVNLGLELQDLLAQNLLATLARRAPALEQPTLGGHRRFDDRGIEAVQRAR
jgi:hypothetical protein